MGNKRLFVIMPFGQHVHPLLRSKKPIDFDMIYFDFIKPIALRHSWDVIRIDEVHAPGIISDQYLKEILHSELVLADISLPNSNVFYELGIRQAISSGSTILIAKKGSKIPFDLSSQRVFFYSYSIKSINNTFPELEKVLANDPIRISENPIRSFLESLSIEVSPKQDLAEFEKELAGRIERANSNDQLLSVWNWTRVQSPLPPFALLTLSKRFTEFQNWETSVEVLNTASKLRPDDFEIQRELGWHLSKVDGHEKQALSALNKALYLNPNDPETHGMIGGVYKRIGNYNKAAEHYDLGYKFSPNNLYMLVNKAAMMVLSKPEAPNEGLKIYKEIITKLESKHGNVLDEWSFVVLAEAFFCIGDIKNCKKFFIQASVRSSSNKAIRSSSDQIRLLGEAGFQAEEAILILKWIESEILAKRGALTTTPNPDELPQETEEDQELPVIIHLSDLHFGARKGDDGSLIEMHRFGKGEYNRKLSETLIAEFSTTRAHFNQKKERLYLVISGDIVYRGNKDEFSLALDFLNEFTSEILIPKEHVTIVPGNHDIDWKLSIADKSKRFDDYVAFLRRFYGPSLFSQKYPFYDWNFEFDSDRPSPSKLISVFRDETKGILFIGLNSCTYETEQHHYGFIGSEQLQLVDDYLYANPIIKKEIKVVTFHHHLHSYPEYIHSKATGEPWVDMSTLRDSGLVQKRLQSLGFDILLHGHKHKCQARETLLRSRGNDASIKNCLLAFGAGSASVSTQELQHNVSNQYQVLELLQMPRKKGIPFINLEWRELEASPDAVWTTSGTFRIEG